MRVADVTCHVQTVASLYNVLPCRVFVAPAALDEKVDGDRSHCARRRAMTGSPSVFATTAFGPLFACLVELSRGFGDASV